MPLQRLPATRAVRRVLHPTRSATPSNHTVYIVKIINIVHNCTSDEGVPGDSGGRIDETVGSMGSGEVQSGGMGVENGFRIGNCIKLNSV